MRDCIFCKIAKGELPATFHYKGKNVLAFDDVNPVAPVHVLIISKKHIESLSKTKSQDKEVLGEIQVVAAKLAKKLKVSKAFRLLTASGYDAGQRVFHVHYHLVGGWKKASDADKMEKHMKPQGLRK